MKKIAATALVCAMIFSLAACSVKQQETTIPESSETTTHVTETTEETTETTTEETTLRAPSTQILTKEDYVKNARDKYKKYVKGDCKDDFYAPEILIKSSYADSVNNDIKKIFEKYKKAFKKDEYAEIYGSDYIVYLTKDGILSVVFTEYKGEEVHHVYNIDVTTGEKVDNARIAQIAGVTSIKTAAMDALQNAYNSTYEYFHGAKAGKRVENYKVIPENGKKLTSEEKNMQATFNEKYFSDDMKVGLTDEGKMFFIITRYDAALYSKFVIDADGKSQDYVGNPAWVSPKNTKG
jgi:hypothetical protein